MDTIQAGHAGKGSRRSCPGSLRASKASAFITQTLSAREIRRVRREPHAGARSGNTATGFLFMVILNMQQSFPNIRVINTTAPSDLKSANVLLTFTERDKMLNYLCFEYEQIQRNKLIRYNAAEQIQGRLLYILQSKRTLSLL